MLNILCGSIPVDGGKILMNGKDITNKKEFKRNRNIGRVYQNPSMGTCPSMTILENMSLADNKGKFFGLGAGINKARREEYREMLSQLGLGLENKMDVKVGVLSGGQRQAIALLMSTMTPIDFLILDEHTAALDPATGEEYQLYYIVESRQSTIAILTKTEYMQSDSSEIWHTAAEMPQNDSWFFENQREDLWENMANIVKEIFPTDELLELPFAPQVPDSEEKPENIAQQ